MAMFMLNFNVISRLGHTHIVVSGRALFGGPLFLLDMLYLVHINSSERSCACVAEDEGLTK